ncbi:hypothetical protein JCM19232_3638 [Vibrio ishigakensis]|uniref:Uncharacterized protein n=1 Tax=Vibrio ishigakensis TaxID=1481914 RepID=A0A0B8P380_9VIBR|nr:hypothetical protein JCM19232_3638 [Vibrio ishigakensis]
MSYEGDEEYRYQNVVDERINQAVYVQTLNREFDVESMKSEFNKYLVVTDAV